ncbi:hypothetical protein FDG2_1698 [Candidatus Protofrankia californiensis]|uniref:Integrase family protein n=1 Tax=Candidatus Protofrankia californiensis TaxID=1839754 RepID=A0A1C3NW54_9ACTN|nr:hypothetical protein FDG2_1698 [Candidatus Protofrankia californiensis]
MRVHVYPTLGDRRLAAVGRSDVQALVTAWSATAAPRTVQVRYAFLRAMFNSAVHDGALGKSPCLRINLPEIVPDEVVPLSVAQVRAISDAIEATCRPAVLVGAGCGLRASEALGLTLDAVQFLRRELAVRYQLSAKPPWKLVPVKTKGSSRDVPAPQFALDALSPLKPGKMLGTLFVRPGLEGEPVSQRMLDLAFADAVDAVNAEAAKRKRDRKSGRTTEPELPAIPEGTTFHDLRHTYASTLIDGGESVTVVAARLGHADPTLTLRTYSHLWPNSADRTRKIVDAAWQIEDRADSMRTEGEADAR